MDEPILARWAPRTKLLRPEPAADVVLDERLVDRAVHLATTKPLTLVRAPAGSGKTTLAAAAAERLAPQPVAWARLDDLDDDPAALLELLVLAVEHVLPGGCPAARQLLATGLPSAVDPRRAAAVLVNDLIAADAPFVIVLDDMHTLRSPEALGVLDYIVDNLPPNAHVVATARMDPALSLARLRARSLLGEIGPDDLRLSTQQAEELLNDRLGLALDKDDIAKLVEAASGWVTGVRLLGQSPEALDGFLGAELVGNEREDLQRFLFDTAVLDVLTPSSCGALTGRDDAAVVLDDLAKRHSLFLLGVDPAAPAYRYHDLLRSFLLRRLSTTDPVRLAMLHQAAAAIEPASGRRIEHLMAAEAWDDAADAIEAIGDPFARPVDTQRMAAWIASLPDDVRQARPRLQVLTGLAAAQRGDIGTAVSVLEPIYEDLEAAGELTAHWVAVRTLHVASNNHARFVPVLMRVEQSPVFATLPPAAQADHHVSSAYGALFMGEWEETGRRVDAAIAVATASGDVGAVEVLTQHLSPLLAPAPGAIERIDGYTEWVDGRFPDKPPLAALGFHHQRAFVSFLRADVDAATSHARTATELEARLGGFPFLRATAEWVLAGAAFARADMVDAERRLRAGLDRPDATDLDRRLDVLRLAALARVLRHQGRVDELAALAARLDVEAATPFDTHLAWSRASAHAHWRRAAGDLDGAVAVLREALPVEARTRVVPFLTSLRVDLALVLDAAGRHDDARTELAGAVATFAGWGAPGLLLAAGQEVVPLLRAAPGPSPTAAAALRALDSRGQPTPVAVPGTSEVLSGREVEVLRLLDAGASNKEVAEALVLSANTVKTHIKNVLAKLQAHSRGEAVAVARRHHLL